MRIIEKRLQEKIHKCGYCGTVYAYTSKDIDYSWEPSMKCPVCKSYNTPSIFDRKVK